MSIRISRPYSRRDLLRHTGASLASVPLLKAFGSRAFASGKRVPRVVFIYSPNGTVAERFFPSSSADLTEKPILKPLAAHKNDMTVITGMNYSGFNTPHAMGTQKALTNVDLYDARDKKYERGKSWSPSLDTTLAETVGKDSFRSVLRIGPNKGNVRGFLNFDNDGKPISSIADITSAIEYMFGASTGQGSMDPGNSTDPVKDAGRIKALYEARKSVLDAIRADASALQGRLPLEQKRKMEAALTAIGDLEKSLDASGLGNSDDDPKNTPVSCDQPDWPSQDSFEGSEKFRRSASDIIAASFGCDLTRVAVVKLAHSADQNFLGIGFHDTSHSQGTGDADDKLESIHAFFAKQISYLVDRLKATPDPMGEGSVFDNTVLFWCNECAHGNHFVTNLPLVLLGSAGGFFKTKELVKLQKPQSNHYGSILVSIAQSQGLNIDKFGDARWAPGPLTALHKS